MEKFPLIELVGHPIEIGLQHGRILKDRIIKVIKFYKMIFNISEAEIFEYAKNFQHKIKKFNKDYCIEIEAIAKGAGVNPLWIYALNSRTEILKNCQIDRNECTALYFKESSILGQNWDWSKRFESLSVLMKIKKQNGHTILMMTEPGIIGKIGMNNYGIGVCLNILQTNKKLDGIPIHIILRSILDSTTMKEAINIIESNAHGKASNILIGDNKGNYVDIEFSSKGISYLENTKKTKIHTNHYLIDSSLNFDKEKLASSFARYNAASDIISNLDDYSINSMKSILSDTSERELPICRKYAPDEELGDVGTVCTIIMDLKNLQLNITRGNPIENEFEVFTLDC